MMSRRNVVVVIVAVAAAMTVMPSARATAPPYFRCHTVPLDPTSYTGDSPRVRTEIVDGTTVLVLVPPDYDSTTRTYPAVYLLQGGLNHVDCYLGQTDLADFTGALPQEQQAVVFMPDIWSGPVWHGVAGRSAAEAFFLDRLMPEIERRYRVTPGQRRAIAGFSAGGLGALHVAARHPDRFAAVGSLSGVAEVRADDPVAETVLGAGSSTIWALEGGPVDAFAQFGNPVTDELTWHEVNPVDLAANLDGVAVHLFAGNGLPCPGDERELVSMWPAGFWAAEPWLRGVARHLAAALDAEGVPHRLTLPGCGLHTYRSAQEQLHAWWPDAVAHLDQPPPGLFDHRRADATFEVWGWRFVADPHRAREFLEVRDASSRGVTLVGSGLTSVTTPALFQPGAVVALSDGRFVLADRAGSITFAVDLGPSHREQQYTVAAALAGEPFVARTVTWHP